MKLSVDSDGLSVLSCRNRVEQYPARPMPEGVRRVTSDGSRLVTLARGGGGSDWRLWRFSR